MAKQYGLIIPGSVVKRPAIFDDSDSDSETVKKPTGIKKSIKKQDKILQERALKEDPTVYQYDEVYDDIDKKRKEAKQAGASTEKKPKYIDNLLAAAKRRKLENELRIEREVQKEREAEGEEFKDKESFVTSSYRKKLEERKLREEQERREEYLEAIGDVTKQANLDGFYRHLYDQKVNYDPAQVKDEDEAGKTEPKSPQSPKHVDKQASMIKQKISGKNRKYRKRESSDSEEEKEIKKEHLPSNLDADSDFSIDSSDSEDDGEGKQKENSVKTIKEPEQKAEAVDTAKDVKVELKDEDHNSGPKNEEKAEASVKKEHEAKEMEEPKPKKPKIDIWKKRTVGEVFDEALQRYFERKALRKA